MSFSIDSDFWLFQSGPRRQALGDIPADDERGREFARNLFGLQQETGQAETGKPPAGSEAGSIGRLAVTGLDAPTGDMLIIPSLAPASGLPAMALPDEAGEILSPEQMSEVRRMEPATPYAAWATPGVQQAPLVPAGAGAAPEPGAMAALQLSRPEAAPRTLQVQAWATSGSIPIPSAGAEGFLNRAMPADTAAGLDQAPARITRLPSLPPPTEGSASPPATIDVSAPAMPGAPTAEDIRPDVLAGEQVPAGPEPLVPAPAQARPGLQSTEAAITPDRPEMVLNGTTQAAPEPALPGQPAQQPLQAGGPARPDTPTLQTTENNAAPESAKAQPDKGPIPADTRQPRPGIQPGPETSELSDKKLDPSRENGSAPSDIPDTANRSDASLPDVPGRQSISARPEMAKAGDFVWASGPELSETELAASPQADMTPGKPVAGPARSAKPEPAEPALAFAAFPEPIMSPEQAITLAQAAPAQGQGVLSLPSVSIPLTGLPTDPSRRPPAEPEPRAGADLTDEITQLASGPLPDDGLTTNTLFGMADSQSGLASFQFDSGTGETPLFSPAVTAPGQAPGTTSMPGPVTSSTLAPTHSLIVATTSEIPQIIGRATQEGDDDRIVVQLDPPELGRVSLDFKFDASGLQHVTVTAETPEAMRQLRQMHFELVQALERNGLSGENMSFQQQNSQKNDGWSQQAGRYMDGSGKATVSGALPEAADRPSPGRQLSADGRLNIKL